MLLLLDNLEQVIEVALELATLAEACPNLKLLVTSRELLRVRGEVEYQVLPLADPDAVELFCSRAGLDARPAVEELCRRLDNMPLALELAAARTKALTPEQILERLAGRLDLFQGGRDAEERQKTLRATIEWSHDLLSPEERALFRRLGIFVGGCTLEAAEHVSEADLDTIQSLVEKSLLRHTGDRFWMLETIREFAVERLDRSGEADDLCRQLATFLLELGETAGLSAESDGPERPELIRPELDNFRAAMDWAAEHDLELAYLLAISLEQFWVMNDAFEGVRRLTNILARGGAVPPVLRARALRSLGESEWISGNIEGGSRTMEESLALFEAIGDERAVGVGVHRLGIGALMADDLPRARHLLEQSLAISRRTSNPKLEADAIGKLGWVERREGKRERALELFRRSAVLSEEVGYTWMQANAILDVADLSHELGRAEVANDRAEEGLRLCWELGDRQFTVFALALLARFASTGGDVTRAGRLWGAIEAEESRAPIGQWERQRAEEAALIVVAGAQFEAARAEGRRLSLEEGVGYALAGRNQTVKTSGRVSR